MSLENTMPESFLGAVAGFEGVSDGYTAIHGPTGCKFYPSAAAEEYFIRPGSNLPRARSPLIMGSIYFFGQPRVPCTYLDMDVFVNGASVRLKDMMSQIQEMKPTVISVINSPGASLIGEDLSSLEADVPVCTMDHAEYSGTLCDGFQDAVLEILDKVRPEKKGKGSGINLTGISISHLHWQDTVADLTALLEACGVKVNLCVGAGWSGEDIRNSADAELTVPIYPEYGDRIASFYENEFGIPSFISPEGAPVGFHALEAWIKGICGCLNKDPSPALEIIKEKRRKTADVLLSMEARHALPKGRMFSIQADGSVAYAVTRFLHEYLGMVPVAVKCRGGAQWDSKTMSYLESKGIPVSDEPEETSTDIIISNGPICAAAIERGSALEAAVIEGPSPQAVTIDPAPPLGLKGTVSLLESVLDTVSRHHRFH